MLNGYVPIIIDLVLTANYSIKGWLGYVKSNLDAYITSFWVMQKVQILSVLVGFSGIMDFYYHHCEKRSKKVEIVI